MRKRDGQCLLSPQARVVQGKGGEHVIEEYCPEKCPGTDSQKVYVLLYMVKEILQM